jgi:hypothetical protein
MAEKHERFKIELRNTGSGLLDTKSVLLQSQIDAMLYQIFSKDVWSLQPGDSIHVIDTKEE